MCGYEVLGSLGFLCAAIYFRLPFDHRGVIRSHDLKLAGSKTCKDLESRSPPLKKLLSRSSQVSGLLVGMGEKILSVFHTYHLQ